MRVLVCGGRDFDDPGLLFKTLENHHIEKLIEGGARGADRIARQYAYTMNIPKLTFEADWKKYGNSAGPIRNQQMIDEGKPDLVIAFPGGRGTADMVKRAIKAGVPVEIVSYKQELK